MSEQRFFLSSGRPVYTYDANKQQAIVYSRVTGAVICEVTGVDVYVGNLLSQIADESYGDGYQAGRDDALKRLQDQIERDLKS